MSEFLAHGARHLTEALQVCVAIGLCLRSFNALNEQLAQRVQLLSVENDSEIAKAVGRLLAERLVVDGKLVRNVLHELVFVYEAVVLEKKRPEPLEYIGQDFEALFSHRFRSCKSFQHAWIDSFNHGYGIIFCHLVDDGAHGH